MVENGNSEGETPKEQDDLEDFSLEELFLEEEEEENLQIEPQLELLGCTVAKEEYGFGVLEVQEIIKYQPVTGIPRCPAYIKGVISLRGEIVPVLDLRERLGLEDDAPRDEPMIVVVRHKEEAAGFLVESITGVIKVNEKSLEPPPEIVAPDKAEFFKGVVHYQERLIAVLNVDRLLDIAGDFGSEGFGAPS
jgi:purine-binding chemotaxis protein CheW